LQSKSPEQNEGLLTQEETLTALRTMLRAGFLCRASPGSKMTTHSECLQLVSQNAGCKFADPANSRGMGVLQQPARDVFDFLMAQILAIHEEEDSLSLLRRVLRGQGHQVVSFARPGDAAHWLEDHVPDLVVVSGGRHGEKAKGAVRILKGAGLSGSIILLLTNTDSRSVVVDGLEEQVKIMETSDYEELIKAVNSAVGK